MNLIETLEQDPYVCALEERSEIAFTFFDGLAHHLESDLELARTHKATARNAQGFSASLDGLDIKLEVERGEVPQKPSTLTLSSAFARIVLNANDPPGWMFLRIFKRSAMFEGLIHYGVIEAVLQPLRNPPHDFNFTRCGWLWFEGMPDKDKIRPRYVADLLWKHLVLPEIGAQLEELSEKARR